MTELGELRAHYGEIVSRGVEVLAISVDPPEVSEKVREKLGVDIRFLSDPDGKLMDALNVCHRDGLSATLAEGRKSRDLFLPTSFLLDEQHAIRWVYRPDTYRVRAPAEQVLAEIDELPRPASP